MTTRTEHRPGAGSEKRTPKLKAGERRRVTQEFRLMEPLRPCVPGTYVRVTTIGKRSNLCWVFSESTGAAGWMRQDRLLEVSEEVS